MFHLSIFQDSYYVYVWNVKLVWVLQLASQHPKATTDATHWPVRTTRLGSPRRWYHSTTDARLPGLLSWQETLGVKGWDITTRMSMKLSNYLVSWVVTYLGDLQPTYIGLIIYLPSTMDIPVPLRIRCFFFWRVNLQKHLEDMAVWILSGVDGWW